MLFSSPVYSKASGSIAGITYGHGRGGMYTRARSTPTNPGSERQQTIRHAVGSLAPYWGQKLDAGQRAAWNLYAANVPWQNPLGQTIFLTGHQHFMRCNVPRIQASIAIIEDAPTVYNLGTWTAPTIFVANDTPWIFLLPNIDDAWALDPDAYLIVHCGKSVGPGRSFYRGPWRYAGKTAGDPVGIIPPIVHTSPWRWSENNICWVLCRVMQADGRLSMPIILGPQTIVDPPPEKLELLKINNPKIYAQYMLLLDQVDEPG